VTILTHGYLGNVTGWVAKMADDIAARAGGGTDVTTYTMKVGEDSNQHLAVLSIVRDRGTSGYKTTSTGESIIKLDWSSVSSGKFSTTQVADVVATWLLAEKADDNVPRFVELPIHLIGHSRGASLMSALSQDLGRAGIWIDQQTNLDAHPVDGHADLGANFGDAPMRTYDNVIFSDSYWRSDGDPNNDDPDGESVAGSHDVALNNSVQQKFAGLAHRSVPSYYDGTIDTKTTDGGDTPIFNAWYGTGGDKPARDQTGYVFSRLVGGARPADGLWPAGGGSGRPRARWGERQAMGERHRRPRARQPDDRARPNDQGPPDALRSRQQPERLVVPRSRHESLQRQLRPHAAADECRVHQQPDRQPIHRLDQRRTDGNLLGLRPHHRLCRAHALQLQQVAPDHRAGAARADARIFDAAHGSAGYSRLGVTVAPSG
jgi:hypothetical protein